MPWCKMRMRTEDKPFGDPPAVSAVVYVPDELFTGVNITNAGFVMFIKLSDKELFAKDLGIHHSMWHCSHLLNCMWDTVCAFHKANSYLYLLIYALHTMAPHIELSTISRAANEVWERWNDDGEVPF